MDPAPEDRAFAAFRQSGDPQAMAEVFDHVAPKLLLLATHLARDGEHAEDLVQITVLQAMRDAERWDERRPLLPWLAAILAHRASDARRAARRRRHAPLRDDDADRRSRDPLAAALDREFVDAVAAAVERLPQLYRHVLILRLVHGLSPTEIAHSLGRAPATVRKQLARGLGELRRALPRGLAVPAALMPGKGRGLAAVRAAVVHEAARAAATSGATAAGGGGLLLLNVAVGSGILAMKKVLVLSAAALLLLAVAWSALPRTAKSSRRPPQGAPMATVAAASAVANEPENLVPTRPEHTPGTPLRLRACSRTYAAAA